MNNVETHIELEDIEHFSEGDLIARLRDVTMLENREVRPYEKAFISLERIRVDELHPAQRYVLKRELTKVRLLKWALAERGFDLFNLNGFVRLRLKGSDDKIDLLPPVVEESIEKNGQVARIINDGMHRVYLAFLEWVIPQVIYVRGVPRDLPYYAFPIPEQDWTKIAVVDKIAEGYMKKWHRIEKNKQLYRDFNSAFINVGGPRGTSSK